MTDLTAKLRAWQANSLPPEDGLHTVYGELRRCARAHVRREGNGLTLSPTDVVHDIYLRLSNQRVEWLNRQQFFATASQMMRQLLVDHARAKQARKRQGIRVELTEGLALSAPRSIDVLALDLALEELAATDQRQATLVELRFFGGLTMEEAAETLSISLATANRDWRFARAWLARRLAAPTTRVPAPDQVR